MVLCSVAICSATTIDIYYPNNNTTTEIYYSTGNDYNTDTNNTVTGNFNTVLIKNTVPYENIIESPHKIIAPLFGLIMMIILVSFILLIAKLIGYIWRTQ